MNPVTCLIVGALAYFATTALNRFLGERNYRNLALDDKLKLTDEFSIHRSLGTYIPIGIMFVVLAVGYTKPQTIAVAYPIGVVLLLLVSLVLQIAVFRRLNELALPNDFVARFRVHATLVQICDAVSVIMFAYGVAWLMTKLLR